MKLARVDRAIKICSEHLNSSGAAGTEIEAYLTRYLLILICASFEEKIKSLVNERASRSTDPGLKSYVQSTVGRVFRSLRTGEIAGLLNCFGTGYKERFRQEINDKGQAVAFFDNIVNNRNDTAYSNGSSVTFADLVSFYDEGHLVLDAVESALDP